MGRHHKSKSSKSSKHTKHVKRSHAKHIHRRKGGRLTKQVEQLDELTRTLNPTDEMEQISQSIQDLHNLLNEYRDNIVFLENNKTDIIDRTYQEIDISNKLNMIKSKADTVYLFTTDYMNKNLPAMTHELGNLINEAEDYVEAKQKDSFVYYVPFLNTYLYEKEKGELVDAIKHIEDLYVNNIKTILKLNDEIKDIIIELDRYYDIACEH